MADIEPRPEDAIAKARLGRIAFRAWRRGFREADMVLGPFVDQVGSSLDPVELTDLETLLAQDNDHDLYAWILGSQPTPAAFETPVMGRIRTFMHTHVAKAVAEGIG